MQKLLVSFFLSVITFSGIYAQQIADTLFGSYIDLNGQLLHDYADQDYAPVKSIDVYINNQNLYLPGKYYTHEGEGKVIKGQINKRTATTLNFRVDRLANIETIDLTQVGAVKIGADSFIVAKGFAVYGKLGIIIPSVQNPVLVQHLATTEDFEFFSYVPISGNANYLVCKRNTKDLISLPLTHKAFVEKASTLFGAYPQLLELVNSKKIAPNEVAYLMRFIQYTDALQKQKPIAYKANWEITTTPKDRAFYSVVSKDKTHWKLVYYNKSGEKVFTEHYDYAHPSKQHGEVVWYYNGTEVIRKKRNYTMGVADNTYELFHSNGNLHYSILVSDFGNHHYQQVLTDQSTSILDTKGTGSEKFKDMAGRTINREFLNGILSSSYYTNAENRRVYQFASRNAKLTNLKSYMAMIMEYVQYPESAIVAGEEGIILVRFLIGPNNQVENYSIIRGISPSLDGLIKGLANSYSPKLGFKSGKHAKEEIYQEIVVPYRLSLRRQMINSYYYYNPTWMHHHMIHNPPLHHINPPAMPRM